MGFESYRRLVSVLKKKCPPAYPVSVRRVKLTSLDGDCILYKKKFYIRISSNVCESSAIETLLHEWAHARAWSHLHDKWDGEEFDERSHDASWGVAYAEVYRIYEQHFLALMEDVKKCCKYSVK